MEFPTNDAVLIMAERMRAQVQRTVKHIPCKLPSAILVYFDAHLNIVGHSATIWADTDEPLAVARIDMFKSSETYIAYTPEGMIMQGNVVQAHLKNVCNYTLFRSFAVHR